jgi:NitT/TauT family transport system permease protein
VSLLTKNLGVVINLAILLAIWEAAVRIFSIPTLVLPPPSAIVENLFTNYATLLIHAKTTILEILPGFAVGAVFGIGAALLMTELPWVRRTFYPYIIGSQTIPKIAIAPLVIIWFGVGIMPKIFFVALLSFFPILINTMSGFAGTDRRHLDLMYSVNADAGQVYRHIRFPTAIPHIFAGLKLGITVSVIGAIVGEFVASTSGLGYLLLYYTQFLDMTSAFAVLVMLMVLGIACFGIVQWIEGRLSWDARFRERARSVVAETSL